MNCEQFILLFERKLKEDLDERELKQAFRVLDKEKKGVIKTDVLRWILKSLGDELSEEEIEGMIAETDTDGSGTVDYEGTCACATVDLYFARFVDFDFFSDLFILYALLLCDTSIFLYHRLH